ncbi:MAG: hypothetical protein MI976_27265 [Pseudomonadales bacterium]|nr:hypothetical protein [Pseudomonadales bacterium]
MKRIRIHHSLLDALRTFASKEFTVAELTQAYLSAPGCKHQTHKPARQFVYRNMLRMMSRGLLEKIESNSRWPTYKTTSSFEVDFGQRLDAPRVVSAKSPQDEIKERLAKYKSDMLCAVGETEEYSDICNDIPSLREETQELYNESRERGAILLGKIKALEELLGRYEA